MPLRKAESNVEATVIQMRCEFCDTTFKREVMFERHSCPQKKRAEAREAKQRALSMTCGWCKKAFTKEAMFQKHACRDKQRDLQKDEKHARMALVLFVKYYQYHHNSKAQKTWKDLIKSQFFNAFMDAGKYIEENDLVNPMRFVDFVIRLVPRPEDWKSPVTYEVYIQDYLGRESIDAAGKRVETLAAKWAEENNTRSEDFFRSLNKNQGIMWFSTGRISPWAAFIFPSFPDFLIGMAPGQETLLCKYLKLEEWAKKASLNNDEVARLYDHYKGLGY